ncbi:MAG: hypothetical protein GXX84_15730 [Acidobacteria bacterium]|nr:hypothetical protein [Acidobacteriota bacterium]
MEPNNDEIRTEIKEEQEPSPRKKGKRLWVLVALGSGLLVIALAVLLIAVRKPQQDVPSLTAEELEQLKYDSEERDREKQKEDQIRDQSFLVRKEDDNQAQLSRLMKDLENGKNSGTGLPIPMADQQARAEEEAIAHVLRGSSNARVPPESSYQQRSVTQSVQVAASVNVGVITPMFVYSRSFGGAKYVEPQKKSTQPVNTSSGKGSDNQESPVQTAEPATEQRAQLIFTEYPPVTLYEGEMLEAVLVNRIIADTEPSPVICQIAKDVFDHTGRYVVIPASSRIIGVSQAVNYKGASRLFITFNRIILPNGPSIDLPSNQKALQALDESGALGVVSNVDRHWFLQFGTAIFFGVLDGLSGAAQPNRDVFSTESAILGKTSESFDRILENIMSQYSTIVPTIRVDQGKRMKIYLSDDILISPYAKISERSYYANH